MEGSLLVQFFYLDFFIAPPGNFYADPLAYWAICYLATKEANKGPSIKDVRTKSRNIDSPLLVCKIFALSQSLVREGTIQWRSQELSMWEEGDSLGRRGLEAKPPATGGWRSGSQRWAIFVIFQ